MSSAMST
jgi:superfamily II DNA or RNA helicase